MVHGYCDYKKIITETYKMSKKGRKLVRDKFDIVTILPQSIILVRRKSNKLVFTNSFS